MIPPCSEVRLRRSVALLALFAVDCLLIPFASAASYQQLGKVQRDARDEPEISLIYRKRGNSVVVLADNRTVGEVTLTLSASVTNLKSSEPLPFTTTVPPKKRTRLVTLRRINRKATYRYNCNFQFRWGRLEAEHDDSYVYRLPFEAGEAYKVGQGYEGDFSHKGDIRYSLDFYMPEGTRVCAAREGTVVDTEDRFSDGGPSPAMRDKGNFIRVLHSDGTCGLYQHLQKNGVKVSVGQEIDKGQFIGLSGNTGWTSRPHLHFDVRHAIDGKQIQTLKTTFSTARGEGVYLEEDEIAEHPQRPATDMP